MTDYPRAPNRMTPVQFSAALNQNKLTLREFCRLTGTAPKTAQRWLDDEKDIPNWAPVLLSLLTLPQAKSLAVQVSNIYSGESQMLTERRYSFGIQPHEHDRYHLGMSWPRAMASDMKEHGFEFKVFDHQSESYVLSETATVTVNREVNGVTVVQMVSGR